MYSVEELYRNVLARDPDPAGLNAWVSAIAGGATYDQVTAAFTNSVEAQSVVKPIIRLYEGLLNRIPDTDGLRLWADALRGGRSLTDVTNEFLHSTEGVANGFGPSVSDAGFIVKLYEGMGRTPQQITDDPGSYGWVAILGNGAASRAEVARAFIECTENLQNSASFVNDYLTLRALGIANPTREQLDALAFNMDFVNGLYRAVLARDPDADGAHSWVNRIVEGTNHATVEAAFLNSGEAHTFVNPIIRLYEGILNRAPDVAGLQAWSEALRSGQSLTEITRAFLNSGEAAANGFDPNLDSASFITKLYTAMGRDPDPGALQNWVAALGSMSRAEVAHAFMESSENKGGTQGFVLGWGVLRASGNPGPTTAQLDNFSDTATIAEILASASSVGASTTARPTGPGAAPYGATGAAANLAANPRYINGATNITVTDAATVEQAAIIEAATNSGTTTYNIADTAAHLTSTAAAVLEHATNIAVTDAATIAQLTAIDSANGNGTLIYAAVADTADHLATDAATNGGRGTYVKDGVDVTVTNPATILHLIVLDGNNGSSGTVTATAVTDTAASLAANHGGYVKAGVDVNVIDSASIMQLAAIDGANGQGTLTYTAIHGTAAEIVANAGGYVKPDMAVTVTDLVSIEQIKAIEAAHGSAALRCLAISGTAADLTGNAGGYVKEGVNVTVTDAATIAQLQAIDAANGTGALSYTAIRGSAAELITDDAWLFVSIWLKAGVDVTVTGSPSIQQLTVIDGANGSGSVIYESVSDSGVALVANFGGYVKAGIDVTVTVVANVEQITAIDQANGEGTLTYSLEDTADHLAAAGPTALSGATNITAYTSATVAQAAVIESATNSGITSYRIVDTAAALGAAPPNVLEAAFHVFADTPATVDEASAIQAARSTAPSGDTAYSIRDTGAAIATASPAVLDLAKATGSLKGNYIAIDATDDQVTLTGDQVTPEIIAKFQWPDILTLNAPGATLSGLPTATLLAANVVNLDADNDQVTLAGDKINAGIIYKFTDVADSLTLQASGSMLAALSLGSRMLTLDASDGKITLTSVQFADLVLNGSQVHTSDAITINDLDNDQSLHLNAAGGAGVTVVFNSLINAPESITHFTAATDTLQFSKDAFAALSLTPDNTAIAADEFYSAADVTGTGAEGTADTRFLYNTTDGHLFYDGDGSAAGDAVRLAILTDSPDDLAAADLVMIA